MLSELDWVQASGLKFSNTLPWNRLGIIIFRDTGNPMMYYLKIQTKPEWTAFEKATIFIKQNVEIYNFDAALGILYGKTITDMIRIFTKDPSLELLAEIKGKYPNELSRHG